MIVDLERRWTSNAACIGKDPEIFFPPADGNSITRPSAKTQATWDEIKMHCADCPVRRECARDSLGEVEGVFGGLDPAQRYVLRREHGESVLALKGASGEALRREYASLAYRLTRRVSLREAARVMGLPTAVVERLKLEHKERQKASRAPVQTLPLPPLGGVERDWPSAPPGDGDGWVFYGGHVRRANYVGQTKEGDWFLMRVPDEYRPTTGWFKAEDVRITGNPGRKVTVRAENGNGVYSNRLSHRGTQRRATTG